MSAFVCMPEHIGLVAAAATIKYGTSVRSARVLAAILAQENINSVAYRYPDTTGQGDRPGPFLTDAQLIEAARLYADKYAAAYPLNINARDILNMVQCLDYQSCEHPEWNETEACAQLSRLNNTLTSKLRLSDDFERVRWEYIEEANPLPEVEAMYPKHEEAA